MFDFSSLLDEFQKVEHTDLLVNNACHCQRWQLS